MLVACHTGIGVALSGALHAIAQIDTFVDLKRLMGKVILSVQVRLLAIGMMLAITRSRVVSHDFEELFVRTGIGLLPVLAGGA